METLDTLREKLHPAPIIDVLDGEIEMMGDIPFVPDDTLMGIMPREEQ